MPDPRIERTAEKSDNILQLKTLVRRNGYEIQGYKILHESGIFKRLELYIEGWHKNFSSVDPLCQFIISPHSNRPETRITVEILTLPPERFFNVEPDNNAEQNGHSNITSISSNTLVVSETR